MPVPLSTKPYDHYAGADSLSLYPISFPTFEEETVRVVVSRSDKWNHIEVDGTSSFELVLGVDYDLINIAKPNTAVQLLDASNVPPGWVGPIPDRQEWLTPAGNLRTGFFLYIDFVENAMRTSALSMGAKLIPALTKDLDRLAMSVKAVAHISQEGIKAIYDYLTDVDGGGGMGGGLPPGGDEGDMIVKKSPADQDAEWVSINFSGFSARFNEQFDSQGIVDTLNKILDITYTPPQVSLSASGNTLREKGTPVTATTLSATVTKRSDSIAKIEFFQGATSLDVQEPPANTGSGVTTYGWTGSFSDNTTFRVEVTDDGTSGGPTTVSATTTFNFVYPYYTGSGTPGLSAAAVAGLTKRVINSNANLNIDFTTTSGQVYYFAYPASYGALTSILDENGFETIGDWTLRTENITGLDGNPVSYRIYEFNNPVAAGSTNYTFRR